MDKNDKVKVVKLAGAGQVILGAFLIVEHIMFRGYVDLPGILEHEWLGWILVSTGILTPILNLQYKDELDEKYYLKE